VARRPSDEERERGREGVKATAERLDVCRKMASTNPATLFEKLPLYVSNVLLLDKIWNL